MTRAVSLCAPQSETRKALLKLGLRGLARRVSPMSVREIADFVVRPQLLTIPGVAQVIPMGGEVRQYRVAPNPAALRAFGVTYEQLEKALAPGGGFIDQYAQASRTCNTSVTSGSRSGSVSI